MDKVSEFSNEILVLSNEYEKWINDLLQVFYDIRVMVEKSPDAEKILQSIKVKLHSGRKILKNVENSLNRNPTCAFMGNISSGKTYLLRALSRDTPLKDFLDIMPEGANDTTNCLVRINVNNNMDSNEIIIVSPGADNNEVLKISELDKIKYWYRLLRYPTQDDSEYIVKINNGEIVDIKKDEITAGSKRLKELQLTIQEAVINLKGDDNIPELFGM